MKVSACRSYHGRIVDTKPVSMADGKSRFKIYFVSIVGRDQPQRFEWAHCGMTPDDFARRFAAGADEGIGFVTAFPHITKVFRYAPDVEILQHVKAFNTRDFTPIDLTRSEGYMEFACYAEAAVAADEYHAWARARSVAEYLDYWSPCKEAPILDHAKLGAWWHAR